jgi:drug/metabolite transporter (DMT)-like permease
MQFALLAGLTAALAYTLMQIAIKRQGTPLGPLSLTALLGLLLPFWLAVLGLGLNSHLLTLTPTLPYFALTIVWAILATASMALLAFLIARLPLTPLTAWRKLFTLMLALMVDIILLQQTFPPLKHLGLSLLAIGSFLLTPASQGHRPLGSLAPLSLKHTLAGAAILACIMTFQLALYQQALRLQTDVLSHVALAKALMALCSLTLLAHPIVRQQTRAALKRRGKGRLMLAVATFFVLGSLAEGLALQQGTLTLLVVATLVVPALFTAHDLYNHDLRPTRKTLIALALTFTGFALTAFAG